MFLKQTFYFFQVDFGSASVRRTFLGRFERSSSPGGSFTSGAPPPGKRNWTFWPKGFNSLTRMWVVLFVFVVVDVVVVVCCCFCCVVVGVMVELVLEGALQSRKEKLDFLAERVKQSYKNVSLFKCCFCCCCWCYCSTSPEGSSYFVVVIILLLFIFQVHNTSKSSCYCFIIVFFIVIILLLLLFC
jgi:hypothetical protein